MSGRYHVTEFYDREVIAEFTGSHPALEGISVNGFLLSQDRRACIVFEEVPDETPPA